jgi:hypothetical protein
LLVNALDARLLRYWQRTCIAASTGTEITPMTRDYQTYVASFNRARLIELIDNEVMKHRLSRARACLVFNPLEESARSTVNVRI